MNDLTIVIPFYRGNSSIGALIESIPDYQPVIIVNDYAVGTAGNRIYPEIQAGRDNVQVVNLNRRGYFSGACNAGFDHTSDDVLILNQDGKLLPGWQHALRERFPHGKYSIIGDGVMRHPAWPNGYVQGTFMYIKRNVLDKIGGFNTELYPLWGATAEFQLRACRAGFQAQPINVDPYFYHEREGKAYGKAISRTLQDEPERKRLFIKTPPEISVIITTYNYAQYLAKAVTSVLDQTFQATEIIVVDDASTDNTAEVMRDLEDAWKGVHYIRLAQNRGASVAANTGIKQAKGRFVTVLDADDWMHPERLEKMYALAIENPHSVIYDDTIRVRPDGQETVWQLSDYDFRTLLQKNQMHKGILYPKRAWVEVGGYSPFMNDGREDWEINVKLGLRGYCGVHLKEPLYYYRRQNQGRTQRTPRSRSYFLNKIKQMHQNVYEREELPMGCCGGRRSKRVSMTVTKTPATATAAISTMPPEDGWVMIEYIGNSIGNQTIWGPTGTRYKYGRNQRNIQFWAHPDDVAFLMGTGDFVQVNAPEPEVARTLADDLQDPPAPPQEPEPEIEQESLTPVTETEDEPEPIKQVTSAAQKLADESGIDVQEVPLAEGKDKIGVADVRNYLKQQ